MLYRMADNVLLDGVKNISDLMVMPGLINLDFADVQSVRSLGVYSSCYRCGSLSEAVFPDDFFLL